MRRDTQLPADASETLDPQDWDALRAQGHRMLDDMIDYIAAIRERPVWQPIPDAVRAQFREALPRQGTDLADVYRDFTDFVVPYATGNVHPAFMGWVHGGGSAVGMLAEMLAAGLNANLGGRDHAPIEVERQIARWTAQVFGFPRTATGLFVTGTSMANMLGVLIARADAFGIGVRRKGVGAFRKRPVAYTSAAAHGCIAQAMDLCGLGSDSLRLIPTNARHQIEPGALADAIAADRAVGFTSFLVVGT